MNNQTEAVKIVNAPIKRRRFERRNSAVASMLFRSAMSTVIDGTIDPTGLGQVTSAVDGGYRGVAKEKQINVILDSRRAMQNTRGDHDRGERAFSIASNLVGDQENHFVNSIEVGRNGGLGEAGLDDSGKESLERPISFPRCRRRGSVVASMLVGTLPSSGIQDESDSSAAASSESRLTMPDGNRSEVLPEEAKDKNNMRFQVSSCRKGDDNVAHSMKIAKRFCGKRGRDELEDHLSVLSSASKQASSFLGDEINRRGCDASQQVQRSRASGVNASIEELSYIAKSA